MLVIYDTRILVWTANPLVAYETGAELRRDWAAKEQDWLGVDIPITLVPLSREQTPHMRVWDR